MAPGLAKVETFVQIGGGYRRPGERKVGGDHGAGGRKMVKCDKHGIKIKSLFCERFFFLNFMFWFLIVLHNGHSDENGQSWDLQLSSHV